jgi:phosphate uptake regulator
MDEIKKKMIERLGDILDAIKVETDTIIEGSNSHDEDNDVSNTIWNLTDAFDKIYRNLR